MKRVFFFILLTILSQGASAQKTDTATPSQTIEQSLIQTNISIADWLAGVADGLDVFLAGQRYTNQPNDTSATIEMEGNHSKLKGTSADASFNVNLRLPNVQEYWMLTFTSYDENEERGAKTRYLRQSRRTKSYGAALGLFKQLGEIRTSFRPRITFEGSPAISHSLKFETIVDMKTYRINPELELYANPAKGAGTFHSLNFNWELTKVYSLTLVNEGDYQSRPHLYTVTQGLSLGQRVTPRAVFTYNVFVMSVNQPNYQLDGYNFSVGWSHTVYKKILDYKVIPNWDFSQANGFVGDPGVNVVVSLNF